jgi:hypothetical protein
MGGLRWATIHPKKYKFIEILLIFYKIISIVKAHKFQIEEVASGYSV